MSIVEINKDTFSKSIAKGLCVVDFYAVWCGPCKMISNELELVAKQKTTISFSKIDIDKNPDIAKKYNVTTLPTVFLFKNGEVVDLFIGFWNKDKIIAWLEKKTK